MRGTIVNNSCEHCRSKRGIHRQRLQEIRVVEIRDGKAIVQDGDKTKTEVEVGDSLGKDQGKVVEIGKNAVVVEHGNTRTRMRLYPGMVREVSVPR